MTKKDLLIQESNKVISGYNLRLTLRQIYYRLVAKLIIENSKSNYKYLSSSLVDGRKSGIVDYDDIEDKTRTFHDYSKVYCNNPEEHIKYLIDQIFNGDFSLNRNLYQEKIVLIILEKQALESVFDQVIPRHSNTFLLVCRGYNSLTQLYEFAKAIEARKKISPIREIHCRLFSDYDPSGIDIQRNFLKQIQEFGVTYGFKFDSIERIALKQDQVIQYSLPYSPLKEKDSRSKNWSDTNGVVELDSLDPAILQNLVLSQINQFWNNDIEKEVSRLEQVLQNRFNRKLNDLKQILRDNGFSD